MIELVSIIVFGEGHRHFHIRTVIGIIVYGYFTR
jgi:hypothetical protein